MTTFVPREQWGARPRKSGTTAIIDHPSVTYHYEGEGTVYPWDHSKCDDMVRSIQAYHMDGRGWSDIAYNYLVCPHDFCYEGRGFDRRSSANGNDTYNNLSFAVCALWGSKSGNTVPDGLKLAYMYARQILISKGGATEVIYPHSHWHNTDCPGDPIRAWINAGCPLPSAGLSKDFDLATLNDLRNVVRSELKLVFTDGQPGYETVQAFSNFNAENLRQRIDDIANASAAAINPEVESGIDEVDAAITALRTELLAKLNTPTS